MQQFSSKFLLWVFNNNWDLSIGFTETQISSKNLSTSPFGKLLLFRLTTLLLIVLFIRT